MEEGHTALVAQQQKALEEIRSLQADNTQLTEVSFAVSSFSLSTTIVWQSDSIKGASIVAGAQSCQGTDAEAASLGGGEGRLTGAEGHRGLLSSMPIVLPHRCFIFGQSPWSSRL